MMMTEMMAGIGFVVRAQSAQGAEDALEGCLDAWEGSKRSQASEHPMQPGHQSVAHVPMA